jgi:Flp pilus assembly pilin Flp
MRRTVGGVLSEWCVFNRGASPGKPHGEKLMLPILQYYSAAWQLRHDSEEGATATEYIVLLVFIALAIIAGATLLGGAINNAFGGASAKVTF